MDHRGSETKIATLIRHVKHVRADVANAGGLMAMLDAGDDQEIVDAINSQPSDFVHCAAAIQQTIVVSAFASIARAFDEDTQKKETSSFPTIFHLLDDPDTRRAAGKSEYAEMEFTRAEECWRKLGQVSGISGLEYALRMGRGSSKPGRSELIAAIRDVRNWQFAHNLPDKAESGRKFYHRDLMSLIEYSATIIDHLCSATGITSVAVENDKGIWHRRGRVFWRHQTMPLKQIPPEH